MFIARFRSVETGEIFSVFAIYVAIEMMIDDNVEVWHVISKTPEKTEIYRLSSNEWQFIDAQNIN